MKKINFLKGMLVVAIYLLLTLQFLQEIRVTT